MPVWLWPPAWLLHLPLVPPAGTGGGHGHGHGYYPCGGGSGCLSAAAAVSSLGLIALNGGVPGVAEIQGQINGAIKNTNTAFQQGIGVHNPQAAAWPEQSSNQAGAVVQQIGPAAGAIAGLALLSSACGGGLGGPGHHDDYDDDYDTEV